MLFRFSQIKFLSHILLGMATVSALVASPFESVEVLANEESCDPNNNGNVNSSLRQVIVRIEMKKKFFKSKPENENSEPFRVNVDYGSGTIIAQEDGTQEKFKYTVLTADHNFANETTPDRFADGIEKGIYVERTIQLITSENELRELKKENVTRFRRDQIQGLDLAVVTFESDIEYPVATLAPLSAGENYTERENQQITVAGWPKKCITTEGESQIYVLWNNGGQIEVHENYDYLGLGTSDTHGTGTSESSSDRTIQGYVMGYGAETDKGVSGGPVFDEQGHLIGVHGLGQGSRIQLSPELSEELKSRWANVSAGIPINTFTDQLPGSNQMPENSNSFFNALPDDLIKEISIQASLPPSDSSNENPAENIPPSIDTYLEQAAQHWKKAMTALNASAGAGCIPECREEAEKALAQYDQALEIIGNNPSRVRARVLVFRGIVHQLLGNSSKKESDWEAASKIIQGGGEPLAYVWLGNTLYRWGNTQKAEELWDEAVNIANSDDNADVYLEIGKFLIQNGRREEGREYWNRLINSLPENSVIRRKIAAEYAYFAMVGYDDFAYDAAALEQANKAVELAPNNPYALYDLAKVLANLGNTAAAEATLQQAASNCEESICGTLIEELNEEKQLNVNIAWGGNTFGRDEQSSGSSNSNNQASTSSSEGSAPQQEFTPDPNPEIATGPTYFCNDASRQTMRRSQPLIEWQSREFGRQYQPDDRCTYVSNRLESYETDGLLNQAQIDRVTYGVINGYRVLCIATDENAATARNCDSGQLIVTLGSVDRISIGEADAALKEFKDALLNPNYVGPLDNIKGVSKPE
ncbi:COP23 domain-containing protein [Oxynema aestuarii]|uniref:Tetratricopeptide repeat protein n=1 Tax=Oxynema aestuarii AP17 TaxID=2064643 RepID=A0A6H1TV23_9CYAN|nr:COP23 domain-containing protein [Oxynema aestuarii]QIZ70442.1 tetratricopeptide repeat protein [Oxynema aestuarii AP17]